MQMINADALFISTIKAFMLHVQEVLQAITFTLCFEILKVLPEHFWSFEMIFYL